MFNMYQELVDRIDELLRQRNMLLRKLIVLEKVFDSVPMFWLLDMRDRKELTDREFEYVCMLKKKKKEKNK